MEDSMFDFMETIRELWATCSDKSSWESGLTERLAKRLTYMASISPPDWDQAMFEGAMINFGRRKVLMGDLK